jgi:hypothetical protein
MIELEVAEPKTIDPPTPAAIVLGIIFVSSVYNSLSMPDLQRHVTGLNGNKLRNIRRIQNFSNRSNRPG